MRGDLHCHTKLSDGSMGIDDIIVLAQKCGIDTLAITDNDCLAGTVRAKLIGERQGIRVIPGVEISSFDSSAECEVPILGYQIDSPDRLEGLCHRNLVARKRAAQFMMIKAAQRYPITTDLILKCAQGSTGVYPIHIMSALVESGVTNEIYGDLYRELFDEKSEKSIYVRAKLADPVEVIDAIHEAGGIAVLANAGKYIDNGVLDKLSEAGLDGIEVWCPKHDENTSEQLADYAAKNNLLSVGGSDFRGRFNEKCVTLGSYTTPEHYYNEFSNYKTKLKRQKAKLASAE